jgi:hypothetical protein
LSGPVDPDFAADNIELEDGADLLLESGGLILLEGLMPTLWLDFQYSTSLDPRITFSRGSQATLFDSTGTLKYAANNLLNYSQEFNNGYWVKSGATAATDSTTAPDGTLTADSLLETATTARHGFVGSNGTISLSATRYAYSCYIKANGRTAASLTLSRNTTNLYAVATFDLAGVAVTQTGAVGTGFAYVSSSITAVGNGWYRCVLVCDVPAATNFFAGIYASDATTFTPDSVGGVNNYAGDSSKGLFVWGAQLEIGSTANAYNVTVASAYYAPRFDYNPSTLQPRGLLIEEARTNLLLQSEDFSTTWAATGATVSTNATTAPSGSATADKLIADSAITVSPSSVSAFVRQDITKAATATTYTFSLFAKAGEFNAVRLFARDNVTSANNAAVTALLTNGTVLTAAAAAGTFTNASVAITNSGNGWYRVALTFTSSTETTIRFIYAVGDSSSTTGDASKGIFIWGAQLEAGAFATSYIPTTTTALTRNADNDDMTGSNFSSWYNASEGTLLVEYAVNATGYNGGAAALSDGTFNNRMIIRGITTTNTAASIGVESGSTQWNNGFGGQTTAATKFALAYKTNDIAFTRNGATPLTDTVANIPTVNQLRIGADADGTIKLNGTIRRIAFYPQRLPNTTLQALTA